MRKARAHASPIAPCCLAARKVPRSHGTQHSITLSALVATMLMTQQYIAQISHVAGHCSAKCSSGILNVLLHAQCRHHSRLRPPVMLKLCVPSFLDGCKGSAREMLFSAGLEYSQQSSISGSADMSMTSRTAIAAHGFPDRCFALA